ncbi:MAG: hypothetical protein KGZ25_07045, partial [Planctomycetes bacterium]|nr:hypothetical protein [Planctomycetota bacterium]
VLKTAGRAFLFFEAGITSCIPWFRVLLRAIPLLTAGYVLGQEAEESRFATGALLVLRNRANQPNYERPKRKAEAFDSRVYLDENNGASGYLKAIREVRKGDAGSDRSVREIMKDSGDSALVQWLQENREPIEYALEASNCTECQFPIQPTEDLVNELRPLIRALRANAAVLVAKDNFGRAAILSGRSRLRC